MNARQLAACANRLQEFLTAMLAGVARRAPPARRALCARPAAGWGTQVNRTVGWARARCQHASLAAIRRAESVGVGAGAPALSATDGARTAAGGSLDHRRHRFSQTRPSFSWGGTPVFGHVGEGRQLPGGGDGAFKYRNREPAAGLGVVPAAGVDRGYRPLPPSRGAGADAVSHQAGVGAGVARSAAGLGSAAPASAG